MSSSNSHDPGLIASLSPHIEAAIRASPCTCALLRPDVILGMVIRHGLDSQRRIPEFRQLSNNAQTKFADAVSDPGKKQLTSTQIETLGLLEVPSSEIDEHNNGLNEIFQTHKLGKVVRDFEEVAVAYNASLRYLWTGTTELSRFINGVEELDSMLNTRQFHSNKRNFVSTSITKSPWFVHRTTSYHIRVTDWYRKHALPITHTSVFAIANPEILSGHKSVSFLEDEVRIKNGTTIENDTLKIIFYHQPSTPKSFTGNLIKTYSPLGRVCIEYHS